MKTHKISSHGIQQIKSLSKIILIIAVGYGIIFFTSVEIIGRMQGIKEIKEDFSIIEREIKSMYMANSEEELKIYLDDLANHPYIKYVICYENHKPKMVHTRDKAENFEKIDIFEGTRVKVDFNTISLGGYILLDDAATENNFTIYLALHKSRNYSLSNSMIQIIGHVDIAILILVTLILYWTFRSKVYKPIKQLHKFVADLATGQIPEDFKIDRIELMEIEKYLNEIKNQLISLKYNDKIVHEEVLIDTLDMVDEILKKRSKPNEIYHTITEIICKKIKRAIACSFWLISPEGAKAEQDVYRKAIYYCKKEFPMEALTPLSQLIVKESIKDGKVKIILDFESDQQYGYFKEAYPFGVIVIPIRVKDSIIGSICIWKIRIPYKEVFSVRTQEFASYIDRIIGGILESFGDEIKYLS